VSATLAHETPAVVSFADLYRETVDDVFAYVATLLGDRSAAEDVVAQAYERAYRKRRSYDPRRGSSRAWLFGIARNAALDELRRRRRTVALVGEPADAAAGDDPDDAARRATVRAALRTLEPRDREIIALRFHGGLSTAEVAALLGVSESNAGTRLHRAMTRLREGCDA
jgi:RNA polymerase sigma-70 factor, ECF subfamily